MAGHREQPQRRQLLRGEEVSLVWKADDLSAPGLKLILDLTSFHVQAVASSKAIFISHFSRYISSINGKKNMLSSLAIGRLYLCMKKYGGSNYRPNHSSLLLIIFLKQHVCSASMLVFSNVMHLNVLNVYMCALYIVLYSPILSCVVFMLCFMLHACTWCNAARLGRVCSTIVQGKRCFASPCTVSLCTAEMTIKLASHDLKII